MPATLDWIIRLADDERKRDDARSRVTEAAARHSQLVAVDGPRALDALRTTVVRDIQTFRDQFPADPARAVVFEAVPPDGGFAVRKPADPAVDLNVLPHLAAASIACAYRFTAAGGLPPREEHLELLLTRNSGDDTLLFKLRDTGQVFAGADALSEFLLTPVFTGRRR